MERYLSTVRPKTFSGRTASQDKVELDAFLALLAEEKVTRYGEIGARDGDTFHAVMKSLPPNSLGVALDLPGGAWGKTTTRRQLELSVAALRHNGYKASCMFGDSTRPATAKLFKGRGPYDAILIDGDHRLPGVTSDWMTYRESARIVAFHDIDGAGQKAQQGEEVQVHLLWRTIKQEGLRTMQFINPGSHMGIGVVWTGTN